MSRIGLVAIPDAVTTGRYFERAAIAAGHKVTTLTDLNGPQERSGLDIVIVVDPLPVHLGILLGVDCPVVGYLIDVHLQLEPRLAFARYLDHVLIAQVDYLDRFRALPHASAHWLPLGCDPEVHFVPAQRRIYDLGFVGKLGQQGTDRWTTLTRVLSQFSTSDTKRIYTPWEMGEVYSRSRIVFNKSINSDLNMRVFEGMAAGALLVTDRIGNGLDRIGTDGEHYITYTDADDAIKKIRYYLAHDDERERIATAGQQLMFARHTYAHRLNEMVAVVAANPMSRSPAQKAPRSVEAVWRSDFMRIQGAPASDVFALLREGHLSRKVLVNSAIAAARGVVRPFRQRMASRKWATS